MFFCRYYYNNNAGTVAEVRRPSFHSEALGEDDIPDSEMGKFIRTQREIDILTKFEEKNNISMEGENKIKKKTKETKNTSTKRPRGSKGKKKEEEKHNSEQESEPEIESEVDTGEELQASRKRSRAAT